MNLSKHKNLEFYQHLGKLFYAIAVADNTVNKEEYLTLIKIVKTHWLTLDNIVDDYGNKLSPIIDVFNWLDNEQDYHAETCFNSFIDFKRKNEHLFTEETKRLIIKTAGAIASAFAGVNKSELIMLAKLNLELKK